MKRIIPIVLAVAAFAAVWYFLAPAPESSAAVAMVDLPVGHVIQAGEVESRSLPRDFIPGDAVTDVKSLYGLTVLVDRAAGDVIQISHVGEEMIALAPDERAIAITVNNASGLAGILKPGDHVGVNAIITLPGLGSEGTYSKAAIENLRVLYLSPEFQAYDPDSPIQESRDGVTVVQDREREGVVILAVPVGARTIIYDFSKVDAGVSTKTRTVYIIELLSALDASANAKLFLYMMPRDAQDMVTSGLWLEDIVVFARTPTPTINPLLFYEETPTP